jgi:hypothetical protein
MISHIKAVVTTIPCKEASSGALSAAEVVLPIKAYKMHFRLLSLINKEIILLTLFIKFNHL